MANSSLLTHSYLKSLLKHLPNAMTCGHLLCGCIGLVMAFRGYLDTAAWLILVAGVLDFGDGFVARRIGVAGPFGKELDSLADVVTFGVLPAAIVFQLCWFRELGVLSYGAFLIAVLSALRLANFNIDTRQTDQFIGVPTPANAFLVAAFPLMHRYQPQFDTFWNNDIGMGLLIGFSGMLVASVPLMAFKFKSFGWAANQTKYLFLLVSATLLLFLHVAAVPAIVLLYIIVSIVSNK